MTNYETLEHADCKIRIEQDNDPSNPRIDYDNLGTMVCFHSRYNLGDEPYNQFRTYQCLLLDLASHYISDEWLGDGLDEWARHNGLEDDLLAKLQDTVNQHYVALPLYLYDHSGITMRTSSFSCPWDSGQVGIIYMSNQDAIDGWGKKYLTKRVRKMAEECLKSEVEVYDQYLTGDVYGYIVEHEKSGEEDSCWGFFGTEYCIEEAKSVAEYLDKDYQESVRQAERDRQHRLCTLIRNRVPLDTRQVEMEVWT